MPFLLYDYLSAQGENMIAAWIKGLQPTERAKLNQKLDMLRMSGDVLIPNTLSPTDQPGILKIRVHGKIQLRPLLCRGPLNPGSEFTMLAGATEVGSKLRPKDVMQVAIERKNEVTADPVNRRTLNERSKK